MKKIYFAGKFRKVDTNGLPLELVLKNDYRAELFAQVPIRLNYVLMKNKNFSEYLDDIKKYIDTYPNIRTISLKTLNLNTKDEKIDNPYSRWIIDNALTKKDAPRIIEEMSKYAEVIRKDDKFFDRIEWVYKGVVISFYVKKLSYGLSNIVYYGGKLVNYNLQEIEV